MNIIMMLHSLQSWLTHDAIFGPRYTCMIAKAEYKHIGDCFHYGEYVSESIRALFGLQALSPPVCIHLQRYALLVCVHM